LKQLNIQFLQGSAATDVENFIPAFLQVICECNNERIIKTGQYLPKLDNFYSP